jgi:hypothetical protein
MIPQLLFGASSAPVDHFHSEASPLIISGFDHQVLEGDCKTFLLTIAYRKSRWEVFFVHVTFLQTVSEFSVQVH